MRSKKLAAALATTIVAFGAVGTALVLVGSTPANRLPDNRELRLPAFQVTGFAQSTTTAAQLRASATTLTTVSIVAASLSSDGSSLGPIPGSVHTLRRDAQQQGERVEMLVNNFDPALQAFSHITAARMLMSDRNRSRVVHAIAAEVSRHGWDGITVDLESLYPTETDGLTRFVAQLREAVGPGTSISLCLMVEQQDFRDRGYDLPALGEQVDSFVLMAYEQHGPSWSGPGPIGGYPWVRQSVAAVLRQVPAAQVQLGIGGYAYLWPTRGVGTVYSTQTARDIARDAGVVPTWSSEEREWTATLDGGTELWWSDRRSFAARLRLAHSLGLGGVALWSLDQADPVG